MTGAVMAFMRDEDGATAVEYGLIAALIAITAIAGITTFGNGLFNLFNSTEEVVVPVLEGASSGG